MKEKEITLEKLFKTKTINTITLMILNKPLKQIKIKSTP